MTPSPTRTRQNPRPLAPLGEGEQLNLSKSARFGIALIVSPCIGVGCAVCAVLGIIALSLVHGGGNALLGSALICVGIGGALAGAAIGLLTTPVLFYALSRGPWAPGVLWVAVPTLASSFLGVMLGPVFLLVGSLMVYIGVAVMRGLHVQTVYPRFAPGRCQRCNYDRTGLAKHALCPECGAAPPPPATPAARA